MGPSLAAFGISGVLLDPVLELHAQNGSLITMNDNWKDTQRSQIEGTVFQPNDDRESVIFSTLVPAAYTAILSGRNNTSGVGLLMATRAPIRNSTKSAPAASSKPATTS